MKTAYLVVFEVRGEFLFFTDKTYRLEAAQGYKPKEIWIFGNAVTEKEKLLEHIAMMAVASCGPDKLHIFADELSVVE